MFHSDSQSRIQGKKTSHQQMCLHHQHYTAVSAFTASAAPVRRETGLKPLIHSFPLEPQQQHPEVHRCRPPQPVADAADRLQQNQQKQQPLKTRVARGVWPQLELEVTARRWCEGAPGNLATPKTLPPPPTGTTAPLRDPGARTRRAFTLRSDNGATPSIVALFHFQPHHPHLQRP